MRTLHSLLIALTNPLPGMAQRTADPVDPHEKKPLTMREEMMKRNSSAKFVEIQGRRDNGPAAGTLAPDFIFEPLEDYDFNLPSKKTGDAESAVRLSDFKGHKPVVLIFGSYT